jgi:hypothetical protein
MSNIYQRNDGGGDNIAGDKIAGDKIGRDKIVHYHSQNLVQAVQDIKNLITQLSQDYDSNTPLGQIQMSAKIVESIEANPTLKQRTFNAIKEGGATALEEAINHPVAKITIATLKGFIDA